MDRPSVIITGGSSGIGLALAEEFASRGFNVSIIARDQARLDGARDDIAQRAANGVSVHAYSADVRDEDALKGAIDKAVEELGAPSWAIACAGEVEPGEFERLDLASFEKQMGTNYFGSLIFARCVLPHLKQMSSSHLVFISSAAALFGVYGYSGYGPSKFAVRGLAETLAAELRPLGVNVSVAYPGDTDTPQLTRERPNRPAVTQRLADIGEIEAAPHVAREILRQAGKGKLSITIGWKMRVLWRFHSVLAPWWRRYQNHAVKKYARD